MINDVFGLIFAGEDIQNLRELVSCTLSGCAAGRREVQSH